MNKKIFTHYINFKGFGDENRYYEIETYLTLEQFEKSYNSYKLNYVAETLTKLRLHNKLISFNKIEFDIIKI